MLEVNNGDFLLWQGLKFTNDTSQWCKPTATIKRDIAKDKIINIFTDQKQTTNANSQGAIPASLGVAPVATPAVVLSSMPGTVLSKLFHSEAYMP